MANNKNHIEIFEKYLKGELSHEEAHVFERDALDDLFTQEALEGFEMGGISHLSEIPDLKKRISTQKSKRTWLWRYTGIAAILILSSIFTFIAIDQYTKSSPLASDDVQQKKTSPKISRDTTSSLSHRLSQENEQENGIKALSRSTIEMDDQGTPEQTSLIEQNTEVKETEYLETNDSNTENEEVIALPPKIEAPNIEKTKIEMKLADLNEEDAEIIDSEINISDALQGKVAGVQQDGSDMENQPTKMMLRSTSSLKKKSKSDFRLLSGRTTDIDGNPLPGVTIVVKGTTTGTQTDVGGNFQVEVSKGQVLDITYIGFETQEILIGDQQNLDVTLHGDLAELQEVVVTAYGADDINKATYTPATPRKGKKAYRNYLEDTLIYPDSAQAHAIEGTVVLVATITSDGSVENVTIKKSLGYGCDEEATRLIENGPAWIPATENGINVTSEVKIRVKFKRK